MKYPRFNESCIKRVTHTRRQLLVKMKLDFEFSAFLMFGCIYVIQNNLELNIITLHNYAIVFPIELHLGYYHSLFFSCRYLHFRRLGLIFAIKKFGQSSSFNCMDTKTTQKNKKIYIQSKALKGHHHHHHYLFSQLF